MNIVEELRKQSLENIFNQQTFSNCFDIWKHEINSILGDNYNFNRMLNLGDNLSSIFKSTNQKGRGQNVLSGGGYAWEGFVVWYLNFLFIGSRGVAIKNSLSPKMIKDALSVNYGSFKSNTESDIIVLIFPDNDDFRDDFTNLNIIDSNGNPITHHHRGKPNVKGIINELVNLHLGELEVGNIQCKTNWNDNAQIPMLWNMIYLSNGFAESNITVGNDGTSIRDFNRFTYSFVTVPSGKSIYKSESTAVNRVRNLSGGNFWGKESQNQVASSIKEIFNRNFSSAFNTHRNTVNRVLNEGNELLDVFRLN